MSQVIWKTILRAAQDTTIELPARAEILCAHEQGMDICIWYKCDPKNSPTPRKIVVVGTGYEAPEKANYLGTAFIAAFGRPDSLVFHVFELVS